MEKHKIDWLNMPGYKGETWNPIIGCSKISAGCTNCYAEKMAVRQWYIYLKGNNPFSASGKYVGTIENHKWNGKTVFVETALEKPLHWKKPRMIFVCSMGDLFHESVPFSQITKVMNVISLRPEHIFIILTKRPEIMREYFDKNPPYPFGVMENMWLGTTAENQEQANKRIPILLDIPAAKRFVSIEPMLSDIDLKLDILIECPYCYGSGSLPVGGGGKPCPECLEYSNSQGRIKAVNLDWVIVGGESGHNARPMHPDWVRSIRDQCKEANTPFFFKQWGEWYTRWFDQRNNTSVFKMYESYLQWTQKLWVNKGDCCIDTAGKICKCGGDLKSANYPVAIMSKIGRSKTGSELDGHYHKEFPELGKIIKS